MGNAKVIQRRLSRVVAAFAAAALFMFLTPEAAVAQNCALCEDCFHCGYDNPWGVEDCKRGDNPECPCEGTGLACNPGFALNLQSFFGLALDTREFFDHERGAVRHLMPLHGSVFGEFDCETGRLVAAFREVDGNYLEVAALTLAVYSQRYHLSSYLDVTGVLGRAASARRAVPVGLQL